MKSKYVYTYDRTCSACDQNFKTQRYSAKVCSDVCLSSLLSQKKKIYTDIQIKEAISLKHAGISNKEISQKTGIKVPSLNKIFQSKNIKLTEVQKASLLTQRWKNHSPIKDGKKSCSKCRSDKALNDFSNNSRAVSGLSPQCRECQSLVYSENADKIKGNVKAYSAKNKTKIREKSKEYYHKNKEKIVERATLWASKNPQKRREIEQAYNAENQHEKNARNALYRARKKNATPSWLTPEQLAKMVDFFKKCPKNNHVDHIVPVGGDEVCGLHVPWNLQYLPSFVNESKSNYFSDSETKVGTCHQYSRREQTLAEDLSNGCPLCPLLSEFEMGVEPFNEEHHEFIKRYEWLGTKSFNSKWTFVARHKGLLGGIVVISEPNSYSKYKDLEAQIQRGASAAWTPKNLASKLIAFASSWMVNNTSKKILFGYSDFEAGEVGTIYQACNFEYMGGFFGAKTMLETSEGKVISSKNLTRTSAMRRWAKELGIVWHPSWNKENGFQNKSAIPKDVMKMLTEYANLKKMECKIVRVKPKGKYAKLLYSNRKEKIEVQKYRFWSPLPYPKRNA